MRLKREAVRAAWEQLEGSKVHTHFLGYLAIREAAQTDGRTEDLRVNFKSFFDRFLRANGMSEDVPYIKPFGGPTNNKNVAGSYAPSSLRGVAPLMKVASYDNDVTPVTFSLLPKHESLALQHLLNGRPISLDALGVFLYRDYLVAPEIASYEGIKDLTQREFGLSEEEVTSNYSTPFFYKGALFR
ncbi:hypothetical protein VA603_07450 [Stenotrophomonas sp. MH1]|uniref:Uncharacterized protein n=1 Tax=Stenotrophomonas capsici TaxID=3110230 RepID=A0ABU5V1X9_9GAMM|nr:hypothetical protein [Stenotrophomonas sp. MH1]MEA5667360.1 hypothetical protein [Stenotrophomonas sp. MH1]